MLNNSNSASGSSNWATFLRMVLFVFAGLFVGQFVGLLLALPFIDASVFELQEVLANPQNYEGARVGLFIIQGFTSLFAFIIGPLIFLKIQSGKGFGAFSESKKINALPVFLGVIIVFTFMFINSNIVRWNMELNFPEFMAGFEKWARAQEDNLALLTEFLVKTEGKYEFLLAFVVIAILPAIGEEILFRGLIQNFFIRLFNNPHIAIWVAGIIFSAFHMQFFGFFPRLFLGVLFGYMYWYSGSIWYPIIAHFINNGFTIVMMNLFNEGAIDLNIEETGQIPLTVVLVLLIVFVWLGKIFIGHFKNLRNLSYESVAEGVFKRNVTPGGDRESFA